jgi:hypothetical protein
MQEENEMTLKMMDKYGWWNFRGGSWCQVDINSCPSALLVTLRQRLQLPTPLRQYQQLSINSNQNIRRGCFRCGRYSHFAGDFFARTHVSIQALEPSESESDSSLSELDACYRCGRRTHYAKNCYAKTDVIGFSLD